ncbi:MAG: ribonuclease Y [Tissierellia bacterium]|nr:ribonuclease Y [Tissierellia bacterium]
MSYTITVILLIVIAFVAFILGYIYRKKVGESKIGTAEVLSKEIIEQANKEAELTKKKSILQAKEEIQKIKLNNEQKLRSRKDELRSMEKRLLKKEESLDSRSLLFDKKMDNLSKEQIKVRNKEQKIDQLIEAQESKLQEVAGLTRNEAKEILLESVKKDSIHESARIIKEYEEKTRNDSKKIATEIIATSIQRYAAEQVAESTVAVVSLPNDDMKGRIIGREGRNIRAFETLSGVDLIIDDTPEAVVISAFEPIRREIAKQALEKLILDGRINPSRIEETLNKAKEEIEQKIIEDGENACDRARVNNLHPQLVKLVGKLKFRTSYGQNVLKHAVEVANLAEMMANEIGANAQIARRGGLLHDIGKAIDHEVEGTHVEIGVNAAKKYGENKYVVNCIQSHHNDVEPICPEAILVQAADSLSAARPGARRETLENYIKRLENLENIANSFSGVEKSFALQAGRELRIMLKPNEISDDKMVVTAKEIAKKIESELEYPGQIKVNVIRETRATEYAK